MIPTVGQRFEKNGFIFRVDAVQDGEVYFVRWRGDEEIGSAMRVDLDVWQREMEGGVRGFSIRNDG